MDIAVMTLVVLGIFVGALLAARALARHTGKRGTFWMATPLAIASGYLTYMMFTAPGWDPIIYAIILIFGAAPAWVGTLVGMLVGDAQRRHPMPPID